MKFDVFNVVTLTAIIGLSLVLLSMSTDAQGRNTNSCSSNAKKPTVIDSAKPLRRAQVAVATRKYFPSAFRNQTWTVDPIKKAT